MSQFFRRLFICYIIFSSSFIKGYGQNYLFDHLSNQNGLSQANVWKIAQDSLGFIWIATEDGVNKYDGYRFTIFRNDDGDSTSLSNDLVNDLIIGKQNNIWLATYHGLSLYDRKQQQFKNFLHNPKDDSSISSNVVTSLCLTTNGQLWIGTSNGLNLYNEKTDSFKRFKHDEKDPNSLVHNNLSISSIIEDNQGYLWIGTQNGLSRFDPVQEKFDNFNHIPGDTTSISCGHITSFYQDSDNNIWVGTFCGGLNLYNPTDNTFTKYLVEGKGKTALADNYITSINEDASGMLIVSTNTGLYVMNKRSGELSKYLHDPDNNRSLSSNITTCTFIDSNDRLWVGTRFGGINIYDKGKYAFSHINRHHKKNLPHDNITSFAEDDKANYWVGTDGGGAGYYDRRENAFVKVLQNEEGNPNSLINDKVLAVEVARDGKVWIGLWAGGINVYDPATGKYRHYLNDLNDPKSLSGDYVFDIMEDSNGNMWIATWGSGFNKYNSKDDTFTRYIPGDPAGQADSHSIVVKLLEDHFGNIWIGTSQNGLFRFNPNTEQYFHYKESNALGSLPVNTIYSLYEDSKKRLWVGTNGGGLSLLDRETDTFTVFRKKDGLPNNVIMGILEDDNNHIWVSTNQGLSKFDLEQKDFENYDLNDGLQSNQFNRWAYLKLSSGELLFGGIDGYNKFKPENIETNKHVPPVYITGLKLFNQTLASENKIFKHNILFTDQVHLNYRQNSIIIEYVALNYRKSYNNQYKYKLEGFQDEWIEAGTERKATYTNLDPGEYVFKVKGSNNDGLWNEKEASIIITITPPFWDTWYFKTGVVLLLIALLASAYFVRVRVMKAQKEELEIKVKEKTESLSKINKELDQFAYIVSHDLKAPLRGISSLSEWIEEDLEDTKNDDVKANLTLLKSRVSRMKDLIDGILRYSRVGRMTAEKKNLDSGELIEEVVSILEIPEGFQVEIKGKFPQIYSNRTWTEQVFTNLISNAIKYHDKATGVITIAYHSDKSYHYFSVEDDGPGISEEYQEKIFMIFQTLQPKDTTESTGIGLSIVKKIIEEQGGSIWVESDGKNGSKFIFTLPK